MFLFYPGFLNKRNNLEILLSKWFLVSIYAIYFPEHQLHTYHYNLDMCIVHIYLHAFAFCRKQKLLHIQMKTLHFRSRTTYFF